MFSKLLLKNNKIMLIVVLKISNKNTTMILLLNYNFCGNDKKKHGS